jgi:hypothetical protein
MRRRKKSEPPPQRAATSTGPPLEYTAEHEWVHLGELDPRTGQGEVDWSKARRWKPLREFIAERNGLPWWLSR